MLANRRSPVECVSVGLDQLHGQFAMCIRATLGAHIEGTSRCSNATSCANSVRRREAGSTRVESCSADYAGSALTAAGSADAPRGMETSCACSLSGVSVASRISTVAHTNAHVWATNAHRRSSSPL